MKPLVLPLTAALLLVPLLAGCSTPPPPEPYHPKTVLETGAAAQTLACRILDVDHKPLAGTCTATVGTVTIEGGALEPEYRLENTTVDGVAWLRVPANGTVHLDAAAAGHTAKSVVLQADYAKAVTFTLANGTGSAPLQDYTARHWSAPQSIDPAAGGAEPQVAVDSKGTIYYMTASHQNQGLYRSDDGGLTFKDVSPRLQQAAPTLGSDDSFSVAPDDSIWFSRYIGYADNTIGCTSTDKGATWTCDQVAIPGATDRMWIVGLSATEGYLQSNQGLSQPDWVHTTTGSLKYLPYATDGQVQQHGNIVYDAKNKAVWQITNIQAVTYPQVGTANPNLSIMRIDGATGVVTSTEIPVPRTYAINWIAAANGTLWTTSEPGIEKSPSVSVAHSSDGAAKNWALAPVSVLPKSATFSYVAAAGPRAAAVYYGSDKPGPSTTNGGQWSLYVAESNDAAAADATWVETRLVDQVHNGNICIGLNCEQSGGDTAARDAGDLIGIAMDAHGDAHLAYIEFQGAGARADYLRQTKA